MISRALRNTLALIVALVLVLAIPAMGQTVGTPVAVRSDSTVSGAARVTWPAVYDSSRAVVTLCAQFRVAGVTKPAVCRSKTGPWVRHIVAPPPPPPPPPPAPPPAPPPPPPPVGTLALTVEGDPATGSWAVLATPVGLTVTRVAFSIDGTPYSTEGITPYCLFGDDGTTCTRSTLATGSHVIRATGLSDIGVVLASASVTVVQGAAPADSTLQIVRFMIQPSPDQGVVGQQMVSCPFIVFKGGAVAVRAIDRPECDALYAGLAALAPTPAQQAIANAVCITWKSSPPGMVFSVKGCDSVGT